MVLRRSDIASFVANWDDKAGNLRRIAGELNLGLDSFVFVDDNPAERLIIRRELPMVAVPELPADAAYYGKRLADAGVIIDGSGDRPAGKPKVRGELRGGVDGLLFHLTERQINTNTCWHQLLIA